jgi:hypothetical protein
MVDLENLMSGNSTLTLRTYPSALIRINCRKCNRSAQYPRSVLQKRFSLDTPMVDILSALTSCQRWDDDSDPCQMHYPDLSHQLPARKHRPTRTR